MAGTTCLYQRACTYKTHPTYFRSWVRKVKEKEEQAVLAQKRELKYPLMQRGNLCNRLF